MVIKDLIVVGQAQLVHVWLRIAQKCPCLGRSSRIHRIPLASHHTCILFFIQVSTAMQLLTVVALVIVVTIQSSNNQELLKVGGQHDTFVAWHLEEFFRGLPLG